MIGRQTLTVAEAANVLGINRKTAYEAVGRGQIPVIKVGKRLLVPVLALQKMLENGTDGAETAE